MFSETRLDRNDLSLYEPLVTEWKSKRRRREPFVLLGTVAGALGRKPNPTAPNGTVDVQGCTPWLHYMKCGTLNSCVSDLDRYLKRGFVVLDYWIPDDSQIPPAVAHGEVMLDHGWAAEFKTAEGKARYAELKQAILAAKGQAGKVFEMKQKLDQAAVEKDRLAERVKELEAKLNRGK